MNWPEFEQDMKNMVDGHETPIDTDVLWDKISEKRHKRRGLLWFWGGGVVLLLGGLWWWHGNHVTRGAEVSAVLQEVGVGVGNQIRVLGGIEANKREGISGAGGIQSLTQSQGRNQGQNQGQIQGQNQVQSQDQNQAQIQDQNQAQIQGQNQAQSQDQNQVQSQVQNQVQNQDQKQVKEQNQRKVHGLDQGTMNAQIQVETGDLNIGLSKTGNQIALKAPDSVLISPAFFGTDLVTVKNEMPAALALLPVQWQLLILPEQALVLPERTSFFTLENSVKKVKSNRFAPTIMCNTGYYKWYSVGAIPDPFSTSRNLETVEATLRLLLPLSSHWAVQTGISYARTTSRITWVRYWEEVKNRNIRNYYANGTIDLDTANATYSMRREINHYNHWTQIGLPLWLEYRFSFGKAYLAPNAGLQINYLFPVQGLANDANHNLSADVFAERYKRKFLLQGQAGFEFGYKLSEKWSVSAGPQLQFDLTPRTGKDATDPERFFRYGLQLGLRRNLVSD